MTREQINSQEILILEAQLTIGLIQEQKLDKVRDQFAEFEKDYTERIDDIGALLYAELDQFRSLTIDYIRNPRITWNAYKWFDVIDHDLTAYRKTIEKR